MSHGVHPTAVVDPGAEIGEGTKIWHFCHVMPGARIGARCVLGQNVFVAGSAVIGAGCKLENNVSVFDAVRLEDDVFVGPSVVFTNVRTPRAFLSRKSEFQTTSVGRGATIGANATIVCGRTLGAYSFVAAGAVVTHDVPPHALVAGVPARRRGWVCACGRPLCGVGVADPDRLRCPECGREYLIEVAQGPSARIAPASLSKAQSPASAPGAAAVATTRLPGRRTR